LLAQDPHDTHQRSAAKISVGKFDSAQTFTQGSDPPNQVKALSISAPTSAAGCCSCHLRARVPFAGGGMGVRIDSTLLGVNPVEKAGVQR
jgi:hypothetical protein